MTKAAILLFFATAAASAEELRVVRVSGAVNVRKDQVLAPGDVVMTGKGRADIRVSPSVSLRVQPQTEIRVDASDRLELRSGAVKCTVGDLAAAPVEIATPHVTVRPSSPGLYQFAVSEAGESTLTAYQGDVEVVAARGSQWLLGGQKMLVRGPAPDPEFKIGRAVPRWLEVLRFAALAIEVTSDVIPEASAAHAPATRAAKAAMPANPKPAPVLRGK